MSEIIVEAPNNSFKIKKDQYPQRQPARPYATRIGEQNKRETNQEKENEMKIKPKRQAARPYAIGIRKLNTRKRKILSKYGAYQFE